MKHSSAIGVLTVLLGATIALAQDAPAQPQQGQTRSSRSDPHIVPPRATPDLRPPDAPPLPYHFVSPPAPMPGQKFGSVSGVALTPQGHLLVFNRNPAMMMVEYDASGKLLRTFNPNIAINPHAMRVDRYGNIWILDAFLNVLWKLKPNGEPVMTLGMRGEVAKWDEAKWNGMFNQPMDVAFDNDDNFYVVQGHGGTSNPPDCTYCATYETARPPVTQGSDPRVFKFDKNGKYVTSRALPHADGTYPTIHGVIVTPKGELWVTDRQVRKILVLDTNLSPLREIQHPDLDERPVRGREGPLLDVFGDGRHDHVAGRQRKNHRMARQRRAGCRGRNVKSDRRGPLPGCHARSEDDLHRGHRERQGVEAGT